MKPILELCAAVLLGACAQGSGGTPAEACTLIGCESGLQVRIEPALAGPWRVEAQEGSGPVQVFDCPAGADCGGTAFFRDFTPASATVRVIAAGRTTTTTVTPEYRSMQPNGPGCPPTCRRGTAVVSRTEDAGSA